MFKKSGLLILIIIGALLFISTVSAADNITSDNNNSEDILEAPEEINNISITEEPETFAEDSLNPDVQIYKEYGFISFEAPYEIYDDLSLYINNVKYGDCCDLENKYGIIKEVSVKNKQGEVVSVSNISWSKLKFTLNGKTSTLTSTEYQQLKQHNTINKYVGMKKIKYISKYKNVKKNYYKTKLLGKAYKSRMGAIVLSKVIGVENTIKYFKHLDKTLSEKVKNKIKKMKKKGWKLSYTYKKSKNGVYKIYGEFYKTKKVKSPVYKYKKYKNYMTFKYTSKGYEVKVDSNDGKYVYSMNFVLI